MKFIIANDHAAIHLKEELTGWLRAQGHECTNIGVDSDEKRVDYPDKAIEACNLFLKGEYDLGILCCGTGIGISISANKVNGIRCSLPQNAYAAGTSRQHNNCQFIAFGGRIDYPDHPVDMLKAFIEAEYETGGRHQNRVEKLMSIESC